MFLSEWREFPSWSCPEGKKILMTVRVSTLLKSRVSPNMLPFSLCNKKRRAIRHMNRPLFPTTLSIPSYDIGNYVGLMTYQHSLVVPWRNSDYSVYARALRLYTPLIQETKTGYFTLNFVWISCLPVSDTVLNPKRMQWYFIRACTSSRKVRAIFVLWKQTWIFFGTL